MGKKHLTRSQALMGNKNASKAFKKPSYKELEDRCETQEEYIESMEEVLNEIRALLS